MPLFGKRNNNSGNNNSGGDDGGSWDSDEGNCPWGDDCPNDYHFYTDSQGYRIHDPSGANGYVENVVINDSHGIGDDIPVTPPAELPKKKWWQ